MFVLLVGLSLNISYWKARKEGKADFSKFLKRGIFIFSLGLIITAITYFFLGSSYIRFGVLHLIGLSIILAYPFLRLKRGLSLLLGIILILLGVALSTITINTNLLLIFGLYTANFSSVDYFPLLPWFGVILIGLYFGKFFYKNGERTFRLNFQLKASNPICVLGRNTLLIYLIHQPIFIGILYLLGVGIF
jgi:uncharacterized membrane protein